MSLSGITVKSPMFDQLQTAARDNDVFLQCKCKKPLPSIFTHSNLSLNKRQGINKLLEMNNNEIQGNKYIYFAVNFIFTTIVCKFIRISCS